MHYLLPARLDLQAHLSAWPPTEVPQFHPDALVRLLHLVTEVPAHNRKLAKQIRQQGGYVPLSAQLLQSIERHYNHYLTYAVRSGLLETDGRWWPTTAQVAGKCRGYRFTAAYCTPHPDASSDEVARQPRLQLVHLTDPKMQAKARRQGRRPTLLSPAERRDLRLREQPHAPLLEWLAPNRTPLRLDQAAALAYLAERFDMLPPVVAPRPKWPEWRPKWLKALDRDYYASPVEQYNQRLHSIVRLANRQLQPSIDTTVGRLHTTLTNMSSELRPFVYADGYGPLVSIDLVNSQPYLANLLWNPAFYTKSSSVKSTINFQNFRQSEIYKGRNVKGIIKEIPDIMLVNISQLTHREDIRLFSSFTGSGQFYELLLNAFRQRDVTLTTRKEVKELVFQVLFTRNGYYSPYKALFCLLFPTVDHIFRLLKQQDHTLLPRLLQALEAYLFLHVISRRVARTWPQVPLFTVHDSLVVPQEYAGQVEQIVREELRQATGIEPTLKHEQWSQAVRHDLLPPTSVASSIELNKKNR
ncbi:hypothetical protein [Hymenobacter crusticola]|uniref:Uncharacterized protein n=1 Tax=Hymenobacter crusticola TaxID=1770526 RepID=A0A243W8N8_9BACT|nr:hypothetical protein [Hymenobacter crusticola]OUJ69881.1 hypothetical protein BXP70_25785 [Hymenobacter crusticola]